jgi:hypothetical protein
MDIRAARFADAAEAIVRQIETKAAVTTYMHRSHRSRGEFTSSGDVFPVWENRKWYGSQFGRKDPTGRLTFHITNNETGDTVPLPANVPRYYVDCAGFVRELLSSVFPPGGGFDPKAPLLRRAQSRASAVAGDHHVHSPRNYPRAFIFFHEFESDRCPPIEHCVSGQHDWGRVLNPQSLRRGDVVVQIYPPGPLAKHTGHIWVVISNPDARGSYWSAESSFGDGVRQHRRNVADINSDNFTIGRLVEEFASVAHAAGGAAAAFPRTPTHRVRSSVLQGTKMKCGPDLDSHEVCKIPPKTHLIALERCESQRRIRVQTMTGAKGWVTKKFLSADDDAQHPQQYSESGCRVGPLGAYVRKNADVSDAGGDNPVHMQLWPNEPLTKIAERLKVEFTDAAGARREGWVSAWYLERITDPAPSALKGKRKRT